MAGQGRYKVKRRVLAAGVLGALFAAIPATAQQAAPSDSAMVNLVRLLVEQKVLSAEKGAALMAQAQREADGARAAQAAAPSAPGQPPVQQAAALPPPPAGTVRVPYVPEVVRAQIKEELKGEVLAQAKAERWAAPEEAAPEWVRHLRLHGDMRFRSLSSFYAKDNSNLIIDTSRWNPNGPFDVADPNLLLPILNATNDRINTAQIRARIGIDANIGNLFQMGLQIATGDDRGPISTNSFLAGGFGKRDIWLQNAYLKVVPRDGLSATVGRFDNPLLSTDLMFDPDLAFDGLFGEADIGKLLHQDFSLAIRGGALPIDFGDDDFPTLAINKRNFRDRYLYTAQVELAKRLKNGMEFHLAEAFHNFTYLRGHVSDPCDVYSNERIECSTDALQPPFMRKGNTWAYLRQFDLTNQGASPIREPQYIGYKFAYRVFDALASVSMPIGERSVVSLTGSYLHNFGFDPRNVCREGIAGQPQNNVSNPSGVCEPGSTGRFVGGNDGYAGYLSIGHPNLFRVNPGRAHRGDWAINTAYKYLESDAVPDAFTDSDFHLGGTNAKGYIVGGAWAPFDGVILGARWLSANEIVDQPLAIDVLQLDLNVAF